MLGRSRTESSIERADSSANLDQPSAGPSTPTFSPRRLSLSKTESIIDLTLDTPTDGSPKKTGSQSQENVLSSSPGKPVRPSLASSKVRTYAGASRSFLVTLPNPNVAPGSQDVLISQSGNDPLGGSQEDDLDNIRESYTDLRKRWGLESEEDNYAHALESPGKGKDRAVPLPFGMANDLKSISELRSKGETRRFLDEMGYLFEGLNPSTALGVRRGRYVV